MAKLACRTCGRQVYMAAPLESLFAEERRCPRCGAYLDTDRRLDDRRHTIRRVNPPALPGPPVGTAERRQVERRVARRRHQGNGGWRPR
jgi:DNA-directed RNA polymerase subunit RPC12/RpoP